MEQQPRNRTRENVVIFTLVLFIGGILGFFLNLISLGIFTYVIGSIGAILLVGCLHYLVWGHALSQEVAEERRAMLLKEEAEGAPESPDGIQDLGRRRGIRRMR